MGANSFGTLFQIHSFGESHGPALGVIIDGCPAGVPFDAAFLQMEMDRRRPGHQVGVSARQEADKVEVLSGVYQEKTLGTPIALLVRNTDQRSQDYKEIAETPRRGHADQVWQDKFGHRDPRGGGRSSGRETLARVAGAAVAKMWLREETPQTQVVSEILKIGELDYDPATAPEFLRKAQEAGESWGGVVGVTIRKPPKSLGQPVFHKFKADLASALMSIGATSAFEIGAGVEASKRRGTDFHNEKSRTAVYGGLSGGITTGEDLFLKIHFKPTSTILDLAKKGRHDPCIVLRAAPVCEAMVTLALADHVLWRRLDRMGL
jgi:chorismate synthase